MARGPGPGDFARAALARLRRESFDTLMAAGAVRAALPAGRAPQALATVPESLRPGDPARGAAILAGRFAFCGEVLEFDEPQAAWAGPAPNRAFAAHQHGFGWLADLLACEDPQAAEAARALTDGWIAGFGRWNGFSWAPEVLALRIIAWLEAAEALFGADGDEGRRRARLSALVRQAAHLRRSAALTADGAPRLRAATALALAGVSLGDAAALKTGLALLEREVARQILPDGGHAGRAPEAAAETLIDLVMLDETLATARQPQPDFLARAIARLGPMARFFRMCDGALAAFHGGGEGDRRALDAALSRDAARGRPFGFAPHSGYHRAEAAGAVVLFDGGAPAAGAEAHASPLAFEFCAPGGRIVVNCGWSADQPPNWREAVRATAAHSALTLEEVSAFRLAPPGLARLLLGAHFATVAAVNARRNEEEMGVWLEGRHDGYRAGYGLAHRRRLFLAADGGDLRGEDALFRPVEDGEAEDVDTRRRFAIRFHLHPGVKASLSRDAMSALLVLPNGDGWRFRTDGGPVRLERSVYLAAGGSPKRSSQIVLTGEAEPYGAGDRAPNRVRWAFQRLGRVGAAAG
ncbi:MAG: heparinase II/III family protein [Maricaulaceae bacterium]|nr:heparinase II/III family protein [Maricaulaceae bacterium]